jgi:hypothetical protein
MRQRKLPAIFDLARRHNKAFPELKTSRELKVS